MSDRRRWTAKETEKLVDLVAESYSFLTEGFTPSKTAVMVNEKWDDITASINSLASGKGILNREQTKNKWRDLKSTSKGVVAKYKKALSQTGLGPDSLPKAPTPIQNKIAGVIGRTATEGVPGTGGCDTSLEPTPSNAVAIISAPSIISDPSCDLIERAAEESGVSRGEPLSQSTPAKRPRMTPKQIQLDQTKELIETENSMLIEVRGIREEIGGLREELRGMRGEMGSMSNIFLGILHEIKRGNDQRENERSHRLSDILDFNNT